MELRVGFFLSGHLEIGNNRNIGSLLIMKGNEEFRGPQETMLGLVSCKFFISDPEVEQSENFKNCRSSQTFEGREMLCRRRQS